MNDGNARQQITDRIKNATNILVTVSTNPTVDELSAALGLTLMLNKLDKHATAVFSGEVPPAISFLDPSKTFENTVDSLRDFIIALDKEKADRLRYRVEDDVVRIFITPYRTRITEEDLKFTHGDFNVELVLALGVENKEVLDGAIAAHGRILHDATVATINAQNKTSNLGSIDWQDTGASSLCEMLVSVGESLQAGLLDEQIATALLTGIVAATNRFSNEQTSPKSMTMAAQLMAAGANQQLIAAKLEESETISSSEPAPEKDGSTQLDEGTSKKIRDKKDKKKSSSEKKNDGSLGEMTVSHDDKKTDAEDASLAQLNSATIEEHDQRNKQVAGEAALDEALAKLDSATPPPSSAIPDLEKELEQATQAPSQPVQQQAGPPPTKGTWRDQALSEPSMGGTLSATTDEAREEKLREEESNRNKVIMTHNSPSASKPKTVTPPAPTLPAPTPVTASAAGSPAATLAQIEEEMHKSAAVNEPFQPPTDQVNTAEQQVSDILNDPSLEAPTPQPIIPQTVSSGSVAPPPPPPLPDFSTLPPLPSSQSMSAPTLDANGLPLPVVASPASSAPVNPTTPNNSGTPQVTAAPATTNPPEPGQFRIPGQ